MSLIGRLTAVEQRQEPSGPYAVLVHVLDDETTVTVCQLGWLNEDMTLAAYRTRFPGGAGCVERWYVMSDAGEQPDRLSTRWGERSRRSAGSA